MLVRPRLALLRAVAPHSSAPGRLERVFVNGLYAVGMFVVVQIALRLTGVERGTLGLGDLIGGWVGMAAAAATYCLWAVRVRRVPPERWFLSHVQWLCHSYLGVALAVCLGAVAFVVGLLLAAVLPPAGLALLVFGPMATSWLFALWFAQRCVRGYLAYLRSAPIGRVVSPRSVDLDRLMDPTGGSDPR